MGRGIGGNTIGIIGSGHTVRSRHVVLVVGRKLRIIQVLEAGPVVLTTLAASVAAVVAVAGPGHHSSSRPGHHAHLGRRVNDAN